jgi:hypothetical protein
MNDAVYDTIPTITRVKWYGVSGNLPWYEPQSGTMLGLGPDCSYAFCFACNNWVIRKRSFKDWPEMCQCDNCEQVILTRKPEG